MFKRIDRKKYIVASEKNVQKLAIQVFEDMGYITYKMKSIGKRYLPDLLIMRKDEVCFVELKVQDNELSRGQLATKKQIELMGFKVFVIRVKDGEISLDH